MTKIHFRPYNPNQTVLFPQRIDEDIAENDPVRMVDALVESLNLESFRKLYKECGRSPYHPKMMLKVILYAYMNNIYSCRKIERLLHRDIHYIWLAGYEKPDFITINRFRNRVKKEINEVFTQTILLLSSKGLISLNVEYIDGTKIESKANNKRSCPCGLRPAIPYWHNLMRHVASLLPRQDEMPDQVRQDTGGECVPYFNIFFLYAFNRLDKSEKGAIQAYLVKNKLQKTRQKVWWFKRKAYLCTRNRENNDGCESDL